VNWVPDPKEVWKKYSTWALTVLVALPEVWRQFPEIQALFPAEIALQIAGWIALVGLIGRFILQKPKDPPK
jgi:hypothetical protein